MSAVLKPAANPRTIPARRKSPWLHPAAKPVLFNLSEILRVAAILLKPVLVRSAETIYRTFNFTQPWEQVRYQDAVERPAQTEDVRVIAALDGGKVKPLFPRIA